MESSTKKKHARNQFYSIYTKEKKNGKKKLNKMYQKASQLFEKKKFTINFSNPLLKKLINCKF